METSSTWYAVAKGFKTGVFHQWKEAEQQISGFSKPSFKKFNSYLRASEWLSKKQAKPAKKINLILPNWSKKNRVDVYVDSCEFKGGSWAYLAEFHQEESCISKKGGLLTKPVSAIRLKLKAWVESIKFVVKQQQSSFEGIDFYLFTRSVYLEKVFRVWMNALYCNAKSSLHQDLFFEWQESWKQSKIHFHCWVLDTHFSNIKLHDYQKDSSFSTKNCVMKFNLLQEKIKPSYLQYKKKCPWSRDELAQ